MNNATNLNLEKNTKGSYSLAGDALLHLLLRLEDIKLTSIYPRGSVLFAEGQPAIGVYLLRSGRAKISISSAAGKKVILRVQAASAILGVNSVIKDEPYDITVEPIERCRIDFVSRSDFMKILDEGETAGAGVANTLSNELSDVVEHVRSLLLSQSCAEKLAGLLVKWCDEQGEIAPQGIRVNPGLTHEEIAQMICASRETVTRLFAEFRRKEIVSFNGNAILVRHLNALESMVSR
jgi:CRP/FNR family transcriptional regulator